MGHALDGNAVRSCSKAVESIHHLRRGDQFGPFSENNADERGREGERMWIGKVDKEVRTRSRNELGPTRAPSHRRVT